MFTAGSQIGPYTLIRKLGQGGFGEVWLAERKSKFVTTKVAIKLPLDEQVDHEVIRQEATLWEQASGHSNVMPIIDADEYDGRIVIVSEYAPGGSLADKLKAEGKLSTKQAVEMVIGILNGLEFLHSKRITHRDIKPQNILLQGNTPRLTDFGISRAMQTTAVSSVVSGTDAYMSPEAFDGIRNFQTDIWSVGVILYQLMNGNLPFGQQHPSERMFAILMKEFTPLPNDFPQGLKNIIAKALAKAPSERYQQSSGMRSDLQQFLWREESFVAVKNGLQSNLTDTEILPTLNASSNSSPIFQSETETVIRPSNFSQRNMTSFIKEVVSRYPLLGVKLAKDGLHHRIMKSGMMGSIWTVETRNGYRVETTGDVGALLNNKITSLYGQNDGENKKGYKYWFVSNLDDVEKIIDIYGQI